MKPWHKGVLLLFGVFVPLHTLNGVVEPAPGFLFYVLTLVILLGAVSTWGGTLRRSLSLLAPAALVVLGLLPSVLGGSSRGWAGMHLFALAAVALLFFVGAHASRVGRGRVLAAGMVLGTCFNVLLALIIAVVSRAIGEGGAVHAPRLIGASETPDRLTVCVVVALVLALFTDAIPEKLRAPMVALLGVGLVGAWSHASLAMLTATFALFALASQEMRRQVFSALAASATAVYYASTRVKLVPLSAESPFVSLLTSPYVALNREAASTFAAHPLLGAGLVAAPARSTYLGYAGAAGVPGMLVVLLLAILALRAARRQRPPFVGLVFFALAAGLTVDVLACPEIFLGVGLLFAKKTDNTLAT